MSTNTREISALFCLAVLWIVSSLPTRAQSVPPLINYQGKLVNSNAVPQATGDYELRFSLWDAATGGSRVWGPQIFNGQIGPGFGPKVPVVQGYFNVILGPMATNGAPIVNAFTGTNRFLEIQVGATPPLMPRQQILSAPYSLRAQFAQVADIAEQIRPGTAAADLQAAGLSAVGSGGIVFSMDPQNPALLAASYVKLGSTSLNTAEEWVFGAVQGAPGLRQAFSPAWTGAELLVWGGSEDGSSALGDGDRYNPSTDSWLPMTDHDAPPARRNYSAVWIGTEFLVWGGVSGARPSVYLNDGGRYDPLTDTWRTLSSNGAPPPTGGATAVWTGSEMIVWGGSTSDTSQTNRGGRYNPRTDQWRSLPTDGAPQGRDAHGAVWTGTELIVWGGYRDFVGWFGDGARYNPVTDRWSPISTVGAPDARRAFAMVWTGKEVVVWGGQGRSGANLDTGGRYDPLTDTWQPLSTSGAPEARRGLSAVWTGTEMIVWGGIVDPSPSNTGGRYNPASDSWIATTLLKDPTPLASHRAVWTGTEMIIFGGFGSSVPTGLQRYAPPYPRTLYMFQRQ